MPPWSSGFQLGPYSLLEPIGAGGMGEVWKARDTRLGRIVAIKRLTGPHSDRFAQEARAIGALNHPHICHAEVLRVRTILEGSVRRAGSRIRVAAQLINAGDGYHLWSDRYDREMADVFAVQDEIAHAIAEALQVQLSPRPEAAGRHTPTLPAYEAVLRARHHLQKMTPDTLSRSRRMKLPEASPSLR